MCRIRALLFGLVAFALSACATAQREVIVLRDMEGFSSDEVCRRLEISEANQRVLLHRARSRVRSVLEAYVGA